MGNFLTAAHHMRLKAIYDRDIKEKIPVILNEADSFKVNRKRVSALVLKFTGKAFREGIDYAEVDTKARTGTKITVDQKITSKLKDQLLNEFLIRIGAAEAVLKTKREQHRKLQKAQPGKTVRRDPQKDQMWAEYVNAVKAAANNLIIRAGSLGTEQVYRKL